jgi:hemerythrin-like domain-containing protein
MRSHIAKEDAVLFPLAMELLDDAAIARLRAGYEAHEQLLGAGTHDRCLRIAEHLRAPAVRG